MANVMTSPLISSPPQQNHNKSDGPIAILWDMENCPVPNDVRPEDVAGNIRTALRAHPVINGSVNMLSAYGDFNGFSRRLREGCQRTGVKLVDVPNGRKDAADKAILIDMFLFALDNPPPCSIMLISGDVDFSPALHVLGQRGYTVILVIPSRVGVPSALSNAGSYVWDWSSVVRGHGFLPSSRFQISEKSENLDNKTEEEAIVYKGITITHPSSETNDLMWVQPGDLTHLKGQLVKLLEAFGGRLLIGRLPCEYQKTFGRSLCVSEYGTLKMVDLLKKMSDVISVEGQGQKRVVLLKKRLTGANVKYDNKGKGVREVSSGECSEEERVVVEEQNVVKNEVFNLFKCELQEILVSYSCRIFLGCFEEIYQQRYKRPLECKRFGVKDLEELFGKMNDIVELHEEPVSKKKLLVIAGL
ncbi:uncharacterized protein LOC143629457 [Bidens hawaiensis]|uniref:uncharacterized protein LOC143629457 n=1 Tax=Bidens hawaiensis TaxID=980011 RepID=UPI00404A01A9